MANPSKRYPWVVQYYVPDLDMWFDIDAFRMEDEAEARMALLLKRSPWPPHRVARHDAPRKKVATRTLSDVANDKSWSW